MAAINGTALLLYSGGVLIAYQKGCSITVEQDLPDATNKESQGWANHINGMLSAKVDFDALFSASALPVMSAADLMAYITGRTSLLLEILGLAYPMVGEVDMSSLSFTAPSEGTMGLSGSLKVKGKLYHLSATAANLLTDPDGVSSDYDTFTISGTKLTSAINLAGGANALSNTFNVTSGQSYRLFFFLTRNSGELPFVTFYGGGGTKANVITAVEGLNVHTLTATGTLAVSLNIYNYNPANWSTSSIYVLA